MVLDMEGNYTGVVLTPKETEVLNWIMLGKTDGEIAVILGITKNTVDTHIRNIYKKYNVYNRVTAVVTGLRRGVLELN
jgi:DNA-binding CsgD family transcriptional regulator